MPEARLKPLTDRQVQALSQTSVVGGAPGLECVVSPAGTKSWRLLYRLAGDTSGRRRSLGLGRYPVVGLSEARERAREALRLASGGIDPRQDREEKARRRNLTFEEAFKEYLEWCRANNGAATARDKQSVFENHFLKKLGGLSLVVISRRDVAGIIDRLADRPARRRTAYAYLRHFLQWAAERELIEVNPCLALRPPKTVPSRDRVMTDGEVRQLWEGTSVLATMSRLQILTAQRTGSIASMRWQDIDFTTATWSIPAEAMKSARPHSVPLSRPALNILKSWPRMSGPYIFGVKSNGERPFNGRSKGMLRMRMAGIATDWRLHDLRRTAVTLAQRGGASIDEIRALTQHKVPGVIGVYARHEYEAEKRHVAGIIAQQLEGLGVTCPDSSDHGYSG